MLHWFPGHMHKARKELIKIIAKIDVVFEVVDARAPEASTNPLLHQIAGNTPIIKILSKTDLADPKVTDQWLKYYQGKAIALNIPKDKHIASKLIKLAEKHAPQRGTILKPIRALIVGIPNVGKSTLTNLLAGRKIAKTGNEPAITKQQQNISISKSFYLRDTPGIMSPSPKSESSGYRLAICGSIRDTAMDFQSSAYFLVDFLQKNYSNIFLKRYSLDANAIDETEEEILSSISYKIGTLSKDESSTLDHTSQKLISDFRKGRIGRISLESPKSYLDELKLQDQTTEPSE